MKVIAFIAATLLLAFPAYAGKAHEHGAGQLDVSIDKETITLSLELPLDAIVGFERAPKTDREKAALAEAEKILSNAAALWLPTSAASCTVQSVALSLPKFTGDAHADVDAHYVFHCTAPVALRGLETTLFKHFKRLYRLESQRVGPVGQGAQRLTPKNPTLTW
jgi:hypothetical protein